MARFAHTTRPLVLVGLALAGVAWLASCESGTQIASPDGGGFKLSPGAQDSKKKKKKTDGDLELETDGKSTGNDGGGEEDGGEGGPVGELATAGGGDAGANEAIDYPSLDMLGKGMVTCKGDTYPTTAQFLTTLNADKLDLNLYNASLQADKDKVEDEANNKIKQNTGVTTYIRPTKAERQALIAGGFDFASYAIFAKSITKARQGQQFILDKPLPVFPWPAPKGRYDGLIQAGSKTWTAHVTGTFTFDVQVTLQVVGGDADLTMLKWTSNIPQDQPGSPNHRALYEVWPLPREATFTVSSGTKDVRMIQNLSWFKGDECDGRPEQLQMTYKLCKKTTSTKNEQFNCQ